MCLHWQSNFTESYAYNNNTLMWFINKRMSTAKLALMLKYTSIFKNTKNFGKFAIFNFTRDKCYELSTSTLSRHAFGLLRKKA